MSVALFAGGYVAFLFLIARNHWRLFKDVNQSPRTSNFRITDIWAAILALTPSLLLIGKGASSTMAERPLPLNDLDWGLATAGILSGQALGIYIGRVWCEFRCRDQQFESGVLMISTGLMGAVLPVFYAVFVALLLRWID